jgi:hypothetical protein
MSMFYEGPTSAQTDSVQAKDVIFDKQNDGMGQHLITAALGAPPPSILILSLASHATTTPALTYHPTVQCWNVEAGRQVKSLWHLMHRSCKGK